MKKIYKVIALIAVFVLLGYMAQSQPVPGQTSGGGAIVGGPIGGGAPIGSGTILLVAFAAAYGVRRFYRAQNNVSVT